MFIERVSKLDSSTKTVMSVALIAAAAVAGYGWILSPHVAYLQAVQQYEPVVKNVTSQKNTVCGALGAKRRRLETLQSELSTLRVKFFTPAQATAFLSSLERLAEQNGCNVTSVDFVFDNSALGAGTSSDLPAMATHCANLTLFGQYDDLIGLFEQWQHRSQEVWVDSCRIELSDIRTGQLQCDVGLAIWVVAGEEDTTDG